MSDFLKKYEETQTSVAHLVELLKQRDATPDLVVQHVKAEDIQGIAEALCPISMSEMNKTDKPNLLKLAQVAELIGTDGVSAFCNSKTVANFRWDVSEREKFLSKMRKVAPTVHIAFKREIKKQGDEFMKDLVEYNRVTALPVDHIARFRGPKFIP